MSLDLDVRGQKEIDVFTGERFIVDYWYFSWKQLFEDKITLLWIWSGVDYCDVFISCLDSHSDGTHSLQSIHWWVSDVMLQFSKSVPTNKQTFWVKCSFNMPGWVQGVYFHYSKLFFFNFIKWMSVSTSDRQQIQGLCASFKSVLCCLVVMQQQTTITVSNWCVRKESMQVIKSFWFLLYMQARYHFEKANVFSEWICTADDCSTDYRWLLYNSENIVKHCLRLWGYCLIIFIIKYLTGIIIPEWQFYEFYVF